MSSVSKVLKAWKVEEEMHPFFFQVMPQSCVCVTVQMCVCLQPKQNKCV